VTDLRDRLETTLGSTYAVERELGGGGMSRVFVAIERALGRRVVLKVLEPELATDVSADRFAREIHLAATLQHPNIVPLLTAGSIDGLPYYVMPFVEGESLRTRLVRGGALPAREVIAILRDVTHALAYAHERNVVHRDIKPDNVLLTSGVATVTDFGIARALERAMTVRGTAPAAPPHLTQLGTALGTPAYMAPEQASGDPALDERADFYALGSMAYELLSGRTPFHGRSAMQTLAAHLVEPPRPLSEVRGDVPLALCDLVMWCLEKAPEHRPANAGAILSALEGAAASISGPSAGAHGARVESAGAGAGASLAVLPFTNLSPDPDDEYFADGLTDEVITDLLPMRSLRVIARASMMRYKGTDKEPAAVARELGVRYALDGSVRRSGTSLRLTARLTDATDGRTIWADKMGGTLEDVFAMQERVSRTIVEALRLKLSPEEERRLAERPINDVRAYEFYLQARQAVWVFSPTSLDHAVQLLQNALDLVGDNALLLAALGTAHMMYLETGQPSFAHHLEAAERCAEHLRALAPESYGFHWLRGSLHFRRGEVREAAACLERALSLEPNNADAEAVLCYVYLLAGRDEDARRAADRAVALDPLTPLLQCMPGFCETLAGRASAAVPYYRKFAAMDPTNPAAAGFLAWTLAHAGAREEAISTADKLGHDHPGTMFGLFGRAIAAALRGDAAAAKRYLADPSLVATRQGTEGSARIVADILALIGERDAAVDALTDCVRLGFTHYPFLARHDRFLDSLRDHPGFQRLLEIVRERWERGGASVTDYARA
jgi:serine/threonine protein kinase/tetratricopeptide (TPR) repeat protein